MSRTAAQDPAVSGAPRLETRWIRPGALDARMLHWFARFPISTESRVDNYLSDPDIDGLSVKVRGGRTLEVKAHCGQRGEIVVPGRAHGLLECWRRWSFSGGKARWVSLDSSGWTSVSKVRRMTFIHSNGEVSARAAESGHEIGCAVELTDVATAGQQWWTLSFEATGPEADLRRLIENTARMIFGDPMPDGLELRSDESRSYSSWLRDEVR